MRFETKAKLGYALLVVLLAGGMAYAIHRMSAAADEQIARIRDQESQITSAERLGWASQTVVSSGRAYLISPDQDAYARVQEARTYFDEQLRQFRTQPLSARGLALVTEIQRTAESFLRAQDTLMAARRDAQPASELVRRFDRELLPLGRDFGRAIRELVAHNEATLDEYYAELTAERARLTIGLYVLLGLVVIAGVAIAWTFASVLGRSYRTEREALEAARTAVAARDEVMGIVAHDLRTPLGALSMRAALIRNDTDSPRFRQHADRIENVVMRMEYLIRTMLDVATMEAGRFSIIASACDVDDLLRDVTGLFEPLATVKQVKLDRDHAERGLTVHADRERVLQVMSKLLGNALKFTPRGGRITVEVGRAGDEVRFAVCDTGPGISRERLAHVFERFWTDNKPGAKGAGLGLFIAKGIIEAHGGRIGAESEPGHGAQFHFTLPLELAPQAPTARTHAEAGREVS